MAVFAIIRPGDNEILKNSIQEHFAEAHYKIAPGQWFVRSDLTAREVSEKLGLVAGAGVGLSGTLVLRISSYFGLSATETWEWLKTAMEQPNDA